MIWVYKADINDFKDDEYKREYNCLSESEKQRICKIAFNDDKKRSLATKILLRRAILEKFGIESYELKREPNGKPILEFCKFSLSHSNNAAVCAISENDVGVDIEKIRPINRRPKYKLFTEDENDYVNRDAQYSIRFLEVWTRKEALLKCGDISAEQLSKISVLLKHTDFLLGTEISEEYIISTCIKI